MNRLIVIGNGFDLAHKLPTSYRSFINFVFQNFHNLNEQPLIKSLFNIKEPFFDYSLGITMRFKDYDDFMKRVKENYNSGEFTFSETHHNSKSFKMTYQNRYSSFNPVPFFSFKNKFFELITIQNAENWVDIENTYYQVLISMLKSDNIYSYIGDINSLNHEFDEIRNLLEYYLTENIENSYEFSNSYLEASDIIELFKNEYKNLEKNIHHPFFLEFPSNYRNELIEFDKELHPARDSNGFENLFLDFNYTSTVSNYVNILNNKTNSLFGRSYSVQIHGQLGNLNNPINFGFGDEMDDNYKILEKINDNKYLENIKSFMYLNNSNYKKLLQWIENSDFQVFIMGHSCGLSDRTLLNTVFEHNNCKSIKIFYHEKNDGTDNFKDLSQNISRHFNKKALMRSKVVDKSNSIPLPQNVRFKKVNDAL